MQLPQQILHSLKLQVLLTTKNPRQTHLVQVSGHKVLPDFK